MIGRGSLLLLLLIVAGTPARAQRRSCDVEFPNTPGTREWSYALPSGSRNVFMGGGVHAICRRDRMDIRADSAEYYDAATVGASITAGKIAFDGAAAKACLDGIGAPACATYWNTGPDFPAACERALVGKVANGGACAIDFECSSLESYCDAGRCTPDTGALRAPSPRDGLASHPKLRFAGR